MKVNCDIIKNKKGFTLVEVLVSMLLAGIVMSSIYSAFRSQQNSYLAQEQVAEMQQNIRAGLEMMVKEIRMAGYDPSGDADATISVATSNSIRFTMDLDEDGSIGSGEDITYNLYTSDGIQKLGRKNPTTNQAVAENIEELEFYYTLDDGTQTTVPADPGEIRSIEISILAKANNVDNSFESTKTYTFASGTTWKASIDASSDLNRRRRLLISTVQCRNMGL